MNEGLDLKALTKYFENGVTGLANAMGISRVYLYELFKAETLNISVKEKAAAAVQKSVSDIFTGISLHVSEPASVYSTGDQMRQQKAFGERVDKGLIFVPIRAQAGYALEYNEPMYLEQLERIFIPGLPYEGDKFQYFEVEGDSMEPTLEEGFYVIAEKVQPEDYQNTVNYYIYVIVKDSQILIKRLYRRDDGDYVMISDNEEYYAQKLLKKEEIKELWLVKRKMDWRMPPPKKFDITIL